MTVPAGREASPPPIDLRLRFREVWAALRDAHGDRPWMVVLDRRLRRKNPSLHEGWRPRRHDLLVEVTGGERCKSLRRLEALYREAQRHRVRRDTLVVAVGGGTVGDLAGFFAATWMRGLDWCPVATTSLAMADSALGGKTAVNWGGRKNLVGSFHPPRGVFGATEALSSLPARHRRAGLAEVVKSGLLGDAALFERLEAEGERLRDPLDPLWPEVLSAAATVKAAVVAEDPLEKGRRAVLNLGHTYGHALEAAHRPRLLHGEAVAIGMMAAAEISRRKGRVESGFVLRLERLLHRLGLPSRVRGIDEPTFWSALESDKKADSEGIRLVLTEGPGSASFGHRVGRQQLEAVLRGLRPAAE